jgi:seryl-tRNA synthetase
MLDIRTIRDDPETFDTGWAKRGLESQSPKLLELDKTRRELQTDLQDLQQTRNASSKEIGAAKKAKDEKRAQELSAKVNTIKEDMQRLEADEAAAAAALDALLSTLPNVPADDVPEGADEEDNVEMRRWGEPRKFDFEALDHDDVGGANMDFETAAKLSGARFVVLRGALARLERALAAFMLDTHTTEFGYTEIVPPMLVRDHVMYGTAQLPKFADDQYRTTNDFWLIPTAEVPLTNLVREKILDEEELPLRFTAHTPCFRQEAGAAGKDTRGMIRQHQFSKVELVSITTPQAANDEHERMTTCAETILQKLGIPYRVMILCSGDMGFSARRTYDLEVWLPGQKRYREISSCSVCGDFQARRMNARYRPTEGKGTRYVNTLNGSALAVGRTMISVIENYQEEDGSITIPDALKPYMGGLNRIEPAK